MRLLDDSVFRYNQPGTTIRVQPVRLYCFPMVYSETYLNKALSQAVFSEKVTDSNNGAGSAAPVKKADKKKLERARLKLEKKLEWFGEDEATQVSERLAKVVILKHMFTLEELKVRWRCLTRVHGF